MDGIKVDGNGAAGTVSGGPDGLGEGGQKVANPLKRKAVEPDTSGS